MHKHRTILQNKTLHLKKIKCTLVLGNSIYEFELTYTKIKIKQLSCCFFKIFFYEILPLIRCSVIIFTWRTLRFSLWHTKWSKEKGDCIEPISEIQLNFQIAIYSYLQQKQKIETSRKRHQFKFVLLVRPNLKCWWVSVYIILY